ncbi:hypothetical protein [Glycomyces buryatensis]|uniref:Uncharacterized protein n=1 Tax=Glycomyces buryatensis TaxID=2570927 RepID=A0A4S8QCK5_9ACTN|nr:hypothetical protein [Glycomyces buryatensis]THV41311.1 hypothetical protein FAB82_12155 [Glycomyces buryatensis]
MPPGKRHEAIIELSKKVPGLLSNLIAQATGEEVPAHDAVRHSGEAANLLVPIERLSDGVQVFYRDESPQLAAVFEMQHATERRKKRDWPYFVAAMELEHDCPAVLIVVTVSAKTAAWARKPIEFGFGRCVMRPIVICLEELEPGDDMGFMLLFALREKASRGDLEQLWREINTVPEDLAKLYADIVGVGLFGTDSYEIWSDLMKIEDIRYEHPYAQELIAKGKAQGEARAILEVLSSRGFEVSDRLRRKITGCQDQSQLLIWLRGAAVTDDVERLFSE